MSGFVIKATGFVAALALALASPAVTAGGTDTQIVIGGQTPLGGPAPGRGGPGGLGAAGRCLESGRRVVIG